MEELLSGPWRGFSEVLSEKGVVIDVSTLVDCDISFEFTSKVQAGGAGNAKGVIKGVGYQLVRELSDRGKMLKATRGRGRDEPDTSDPNENVDESSGDEEFELPEDAVRKRATPSA